MHIKTILPTTLVLFAVIGCSPPTEVEMANPSQPPSTATQDEVDHKQPTASRDTTIAIKGLRISDKGQAFAPETQPFGAEAFGDSDGTTIRWLGMSGFLINSRGTTLMIDPVLEEFDMPLLIKMPISATGVPRLDAVLVTHGDNDHYSVATNRVLGKVARAFHSTQYVDSLMKKEGLPSIGHDIDDKFRIGHVQVTVTPADHAWQNETTGASERQFHDEDCAGFWIETADGTIWMPGDSRLIPEHHLKMTAPDALLFDFSDSEWHFGLEGAVQIANAYPDTPLLLHHWGSVDAPDFAPFNGDPRKLYEMVSNPERIHVLAPGEPFTLRRLDASLGSGESGKHSNGQADERLK